MNPLLRNLWVPRDRPWLTPEANAIKNREIMAKQADSGSAVAASAKGLASADKQIAMLKDALLPYDPHIVTVPTSLPFRGGFDYEHKGTPFEDYEVRSLQYVTLVGETDRDTARPWPAAEWMDVIEARSPASIAARSHTTTPNAAAALAAKESKVPKTKISFGDYKNMKKTGVKSSPNHANTKGLGHARNVSGGEPLSRDNSFEGQNGNSSFTSSKGAVKGVERPAVQASVLSNTKTHPPAATNGHTHTSDRREPTSHPLKDRYPDPIKHSLPPRPHSPPRSTPTYNLPDPKQTKRPLESVDTTQPEKRSKIEHSRTPSNSQHHSRTPSGSQNHLPRKPNTPLDPRPSPLKSQSNSQQIHASPQTKKPPVTKSVGKDTSRSSEKPLDLPPLLSPLPTDLTTAPGSGFAAKKPDGRKSAQGTPSKSGLGGDTTVVKKMPSPLITVPEPRAGSFFELPPLLSPTLPDIVEQELLRLQQKAGAVSNEARLNSVEARHEKARRPDTPGVARKTTTAKVGHPPKKAHGESSKSHTEKLVSSGGAEAKSAIVKLKYKKRKANDIQRILGMRAKPSQEFLRLEKAWLGEKQDKPKERLPQVDEDDTSDTDEPIARTAAKAPVSASKKRPLESESQSSKRSEPVEHRPEPAPKRQKLPDSIDVAKSKTALEPAFKSPALSQPSQKNLLATPKKADVSKSMGTAMRKVNSTDGHAHTPQTSTPASAERPRTNGVNGISSHVDTKKELGTYLKRRMDSILHLKGGNRDTVSETQRKLGLSVALECLAVYMIAFAASDKMMKRRSIKDWESVVQLGEFINGLVRGTVLQRLSFELGALCREELGKAYAERLNEKFDAELAKLYLGCSGKKDRNWFLAHATAPEVVTLRLGEGDTGERTLGPWSSMPEAKEYTFEVLEVFDRKEKTGWRATESVPGSRAKESPEDVRGRAS